MIVGPAVPVDGDADDDGRNDRSRVDPDAVFSGLQAWKKGERHEDEDDED